MSRKRLFVASVVVEAVIYAEDEHEAREVLGTYRHDILADVYTNQWDVLPMVSVPDGWEAGALVWASADSGDVTLGDALVEASRGE